MALTLKTPRTATEWSSLLTPLREKLKAWGYLEVLTPALVEAGAFESAIDALGVSFGSGMRELHTSPEIEMKKTIVREPRSIYQIARVFRDDPETGVHLKEFTMLEFYRMGGEESRLVEETLDLVRAVSGQEFPLVETSVKKLFQTHLSLDLEALADVDFFRETLRKKKVIDCFPSDTWSDLFHRAFTEKLEPQLDSKVPSFVRDFPCAVSPLSAPKTGNFWAARFELYWRGLELANGCRELRDPKILETRYRQMSAERSARGKAPHPYPTELLSALEKGLPECAGVAVGLERLFTAASL